MVKRLHARKYGVHCHHETGRTDPIPTDDLDTIRVNGFNLIRIPVKWDDHADGYGNINTTTLNRLKTMWKQIGNGFKGYSDRLIYETLNEPHVMSEANVIQTVYGEGYRLLYPFTE